MQYTNRYVLNEYLKLLLFIIAFQLAFNIQNINIYLINFIELLVVIRIKPTNDYRFINDLPMDLIHPILIINFNPYIYSRRLWTISYYNYKTRTLVHDCEKLTIKANKLSQTCQKIEPQLIQTAVFLNTHPEQQTLNNRCQYVWWRQYYLGSNQKIRKLSYKYNTKRQKLNILFDKVNKF